MLMNHVSYFDGDDKSKCLLWVDNLERIAKEANMPLREAIAAKAGPNILTVLSRHPSAPDAELKRVNPRKLLKRRNKVRSKPLLEKDETSRK